MDGDKADDLTGSQIESVDDDPEVEIIEILDPYSSEEESEPSEAGSQEEIEHLRAELASLSERSVRTMADFENFRKRVAKEKEKSRRYAGFEVLRELLGVVDNLERAVSAEGSAEDLREGVTMILKQLGDLFERSGVERIEAFGQPFDPTLHEAVAKIESNEVNRPTVEAEMQAGYRLYDRLLRPSVVRVAVPPLPSEKKDGGQG